jgi:hypothetical protein
MSELIVLENKKPIDVFGTDGGLDPIIEKVREQVLSEVLDASTEEGRKRIGSVAKKIGSTKVTLQNMALELTEDWRKKTAAVNAEKKRMSEELDALRNEIKAPLDEFKAREAQRIKAHEERIEAIKNTAIFDGYSPCSNELKEAIAKLEKLNKVNLDWEEFSARASEVYEITLERLKGMLSERSRYEAEQAELERLRKEKEERERQEREERLKQEAAEAARKEAEAKAREEKEKLEREKQEIAERAEALEKQRIASEEKAKRDAEEAALKAAAEKEAALKAEREKVASEKKAQEEALAKREADKKHQSKINNEALMCLSPIIGEEGAKEVIKAIAQGKIANVKILY